MSTHRLLKSYLSLVIQLSFVSIPNHSQEAFADIRWRVAMDEKINYLKKNETWEIVDLPTCKKPVGCLWVYTVKYN